MCIRDRTGTEVESAAGCAAACCQMGSKCITWQYRRDKGCLLGGDVRVGQEKDGPGNWCEDSAPAVWHGQALDIGRDSACGDGWEPNSLSGQCFGLGDRQRISPDTAVACRDACCAQPECLTWQFREDKGCFYAPTSRAHKNACEAPEFSPYRGQRKVVSTRKYQPPARSPQKYAGWDKPS
eukprot:TRINITY_DN32618_c0_g1_i1.p1 TRINITY_DN32618_c0_g1~~TRINITY_DN32618_c0_g1_i1.p1  ORF type:complete len:207 (+),score=15.04 TRINITY_DN32618_c0_g1_i1:79-621(+)